jgi:protease IV
VIDKGYADFTGKVAAARKKPVEEIDAIARGRVWSGAQAKERGLVDELGGFEAAVADAAARAKLGKPDAYRVRYVEKITSPFSQFMGGFAGSHIGKAWLKDSDFARALLAKAMPETDAQLRFVEQAANSRGGAPVKGLVYCFCGL